MSAIEYSIDSGGAADFSADAARPGDLDQLRPLPRISIHAFCES